MRLLESVIEVNADQPEQMLTLLKKHYPNLEGRKVAVLGMAFKPGTDDIRESPAIPVTQRLLDEKACVTAYDPIARHEAEKVFGATITFKDDLREAIAGAEAIFFVDDEVQREREARERLHEVDLRRVGCRTWRRRGGTWCGSRNTWPWPKAGGCTIGCTNC